MLNLNKSYKVKKIKNFFSWSPKSYRNDDNKRLLKLKGTKKEAYIIGASPSINKLDLLNLQDDFVLTVSNLHEHPDIKIINPAIHIFAKSHPPITNTVWSRWMKRCEQKLPGATEIFFHTKDYRSSIPFFNQERKISHYSTGGTLPLDFTIEVIAPWSVVVLALQMAIYMKFERITLIGVDHNWQCCSKYDHFYSEGTPSLEYYLKQENIKIPNNDVNFNLSKEILYKQYALYQQYETLKLYAEECGIQIYNGDPYSNFDVFNKVDCKVSAVL